MYGNCIITDSQGVVLCRTDQKKLNWYLSRNLADLVDNVSCPTIRLRFEPSGRKGAQHPYLIAEKANRCVCCGSEDRITRHHVVPYGFRKYFPKVLKEHSLYDVMPLCVNCHEQYEVSASELKKELSKQYDIPLTGKGCYFDKSLRSIRGAGRALLNNVDKIPKARQEILLNKLKKYYNKQDITHEDLVKAANIDSLIQTPEFVSFGKYIVDHCDLQKFVVMWRSHFVEKMCPQYLPDLWDINYCLEDQL